MAFIALPPDIRGSKKMNSFNAYIVTDLHSLKATHFVYSM